MSQNPHYFVVPFARYHYTVSLWQAKNKHNISFTWMG